MKSQYEGSCPVCSKSFKVNDEIFLSKVNDSWIKCVDKECFIQQGGKVFEGGSKKPFVSQKFPIGDHKKVFEKAEALLDSFKKKREKDHGENIAKLTIAEELQAVESFYKTLSGSYKP